MKLVHLADLHLGKKVNEFSMIDDQEYILKEIINISIDLFITLKSQMQTIQSFVPNFDCIYYSCRSLTQWI